MLEMSPGGARNVSGTVLKCLREWSEMFLGEFRNVSGSGPKCLRDARVTLSWTTSSKSLLMKIVALREKMDDQNN